MSFFEKLFSLVLVVSTLAGGVLGCGGSSNNDQGTSFLALGWYIEVDDEVVPVGHASLALGTDTPTLFTDDVFGDGRQTFLLMGLQNRLTSQFLRLQRTDCSYEIQGSDPGFQIPNDSTAISFLLGPQTTDAATSEDENVLPQVVFYPVDLITTDIYAFLNNNRSHFPELPFNMTVTCTATGITQAGDELTTNTINFPITMTDTAECCTGTGAQGNGGFQIGTGSGGNPVTFSGGGAETETVEAAE